MKTTEMRKKLLALLLVLTLMTSAVAASFAEEIPVAPAEAAETPAPVPTAVIEGTDLAIDPPAEDETPAGTPAETAPAEGTEPETPAEEAPIGETEAPAPEAAAEPAEEAKVVYTYEKDEEGNLVLDDNGMPLVTVPEGADIPVKYEKDEEGKLVLDENGDPIIVETVPAQSVVVSTLEDKLNPDRQIVTYLSTVGDIHYGDEVTFITILYGYENALYTLQWQQRDPGSEWYDLEDETTLALRVVVTPENINSLWRITLDIYDVIETDTEVVE